MDNVVLLNVVWTLFSTYTQHSTS